MAVTHLLEDTKSEYKKTGTENWFNSLSSFFFLLVYLINVHCKSMRKCVQTKVKEPIILPYRVLQSLGEKFVSCCMQTAGTQLKQISGWLHKLRLYNKILKNSPQVKTVSSSSYNYARPKCIPFLMDWFNEDTNKCKSNTFNLKESLPCAELLNCPILYQLSHQESPRILERATYPFTINPICTLDSLFCMFIFISLPHYNSTLLSLCIFSYYSLHSKN